MPGVLADLESKSDYQVLLVQAKPELAKQLALANPGFDVVVATSQFDDILSREPEMLNGGKTTLVTVGKKGQTCRLDRPLSPGLAPRAVSPGDAQQAIQ